jgi:thymidine phosphorylase
VVDDPKSALPLAPVVIPVIAPRTGYLGGVDAEGIGRIAAGLGAGRIRKGDAVDPAVGLTLTAKVADRVDRGQEIGLIHARDEDAGGAAAERLLTSIRWSEDPVSPLPLVYGWQESPDE